MYNESDETFVLAVVNKYCTAAVESQTNMLVEIHLYHG